MQTQVVAATISKVNQQIGDNRSNQQAGTQLKLQHKACARLYKAGLRAGAKPPRLRLPKARADLWHPRALEEPFLCAACTKQTVSPWTLPERSLQAKPQGIRRLATAAAQRHLRACKRDKADCVVRNVFSRGPVQGDRVMAVSVHCAPSAAEMRTATCVSGEGSRPPS